MKKPSFFAVALSVVCSMVCSITAPLTLPATAQELNLGPIIDPMIAGQAAAQRQIAEQEYRKATGRSPQGAVKGTATTKKPVLQGSTHFKSNLTARKRNLAQIVAKVRASDPQAAAGLESAFAKGDPIAAIAPALRRYDLRTDDVADAAAAYVVTAWYAVQGRSDDAPRSHVQGVREQIRRTLLSLPEFGRTSDATKQQMAEALLVQMMIADASFTAAKGKPAQMTKTKAAINQGVRSTLHLDLSKLKLGSQGLHT